MSKRYIKSPLQDDAVFDEMELAGVSGESLVCRVIPRFKQSSVKALSLAVPGLTIRAPLAGLGLGHQKQWYKRRTTAA